MKRHPALSMVQVWTACAIAFYILPFELIGRQTTLYGYAILALFIATFCLGGITYSLLHSERLPVNAPAVAIDFMRVDRVLSAVSLLSIALLVPQLIQGDALNLTSVWQERSARAIDVMVGAASESSILFQISFVLYPATYIIFIREIIFRDRPGLVRIGIFGLIPIIFFCLVSGGRGPLLYALAISLASALIRRRLQSEMVVAGSRINLSRVVPITLFVLISLAALNYFVSVFIVRAESVGGVEAMFQVTQVTWGVTFSGPVAELMFAVLGVGNTYLIFVFLWYLLQGLVMANTLFTDYVGPPHLGIYGVEFITAVMRRANGDLVADRFYSLLSLNTYGFYPSAFGSLFVDFKFFGLLPTLVWGYWAAMVYVRVRRSDDPRWLLAAPVVMLGILFSVINTPIGFANGSITHFWLVVVFFLAKSQSLTVAKPSGVKTSPRASLS
jgi:hypothetical protein